MDHTRQFIALAAAGLLLCAGCGGSRATKGNSEGTAMGGAQDTIQMTGTVIIVDEGMRRINMRDDAGTVRDLTIETTDELTRDGQIIMLREIRPGDRVQVSFTGTADNIDVQKVMVMPSTAAGDVETSTVTPNAPASTLP